MGDEKNKEANGDAFVRITNREIYDAIVNLRDRMASIERNLESIIGGPNQPGELGELRKRVRALELRTYAVISGIVTMLPVLARMGGII